MNTLEQAPKTPLNRIIKKTGKNRKQLTAMIQKSGLTRQGELRTMVMRKLGLSYTDANILVHAVEKPAEPGKKAPAPEPDVLDEIYKGAKAPLRPIHEAIYRELDRFAEYEVVARKSYVVLRRKKPFAMLGPSGSKRVDLGLNVKDLPPAKRLIEEPRGSVVNYMVHLTDPTQVNAELTAWIKFAYEDAG